MADRFDCVFFTEFAFNDGDCAGEVTSFTKV